MADETYFNLARLLPCRIVDYHRGPRNNFINSCDLSPSNEFSVESNLRAQRWLYEHQNPVNCSGKRFAIIEKCATSGFGSTIHQVAWAFGMALAQDRIAIYQTPGNYIYGGCPLSTPDCLFLPITHCTLPNKTEKDQIIHINSNFGFWTKPVNAEVFQNNTFNWYRTHLIFYLMRPKPEMLRQIQAIISRDIPGGSLELHRPYIALYVRRSDKVWSREMSQAYSIDKYFELFDADARRANISKIYINSEDGTVFKEFEEFNKKKQNYYQLLSINTTRNAILSTYMRSSPKRRTEFTAEYLTDLFIEVHADLHAGTLTSNWCRLVDEIRLALGKIIPFYTPENRHVMDG